MVLAAPGLLLTPPPSSSPPKTPFRSETSPRSALPADGEANTGTRTAYPPRRGRPGPAHRTACAARARRSARKTYGAAFTHRDTHRCALETYAILSFTLSTSSQRENFAGPASTPCKATTVLRFDRFVHPRGATGDHARGQQALDAGSAPGCCHAAASSARHCGVTGSPGAAGRRAKLSRPKCSHPHILSRSELAPSDEANDGHEKAGRDPPDAGCPIGWRRRWR